jgi:hypothetical protein
MRRVAVFGMGLFVLALALPSFAQKQFSAEFVDSGRDSNFNRAKIYVGDRKFRIEPEGRESNSPMSMSALVMDGSGQNSFAVIDSQKMVVENVMNGPRGSAMLPEAMATLDLNDPCSSINKWHEEHHNHSGKTQLSNCKNLGTEHVNGRTATKWQATNAEGQTGYFWLDPELHFMIKADTADGGHMDLQNIKEGNQPASLFEPPAGYRVVTVQQMMQGGMGKR